MGYVCFIVNEQNQPLIPTTNPKKVRKLLASGKRKTRKLEKCELVKKFSGGWRPFDPSEKKRKRN